MNLFHFGLTATVLQGAFLTVFIVVSQTRFSAMGKPVILFCALLVMALLLWHGVRRARNWRALFLLPLALALGYILSYHLLGLIGFRGLLSDFDWSSADYLISVLSVTGTVLAFYAVSTVLIYFVDKTLRARTHKRDT